MKVQEVKIDKFKSIENFEANFHGKHVLLIGENCIGKSTIMGFIRIALGDQMTIPPGAEGEGYVVADKNGEKYTFHVKFKDGKPKVTIISSNGMKDTTKGYLSKICGAQDFNIDEFVKKSESEKGRREQVEDFKKLLPVEVQEDLRRYENNIKAAYDERHDLNKEIKTLESKIKLHRLYAQTPNLDNYKEVDIKILGEKKENIRTKLNNQYSLNKLKNDELRKHHTANSKALMSSWHEEKAKIDKECAEFNENQKAINERIIKSEQALKTLQETGYSGNEVSLHISKLRGGLANYKKPIDLYSKEPDQLPEPTYIKEMPDDAELVAIDNEIATAASINKDFNDAQELIKMMKDFETWTNESGDLTVKMDTQKQAIEDAIKDIDSPVEGLGYNEEGLVYNGISVHPASLSTSEIMELGYRMKIAENPESPLFIEGMESMGREKKKALFEFANKLNVQVIGEQVKEDQQTLQIELI